MLSFCICKSTRNFFFANSVSGQPAATHAEYEESLSQEDHALSEESVLAVDGSSDADSQVDDIAECSDDQSDDQEEKREKDEEEK